MAHDDIHYVERDTGAGAGLWAIVAVVIVLFVLLYFGSSLFGKRDQGTAGIKVQENVLTPEGSSGTQ